MQPANTPYRAEKIRETASALKDGYVIKESSGIIVAACPHAHGGPLTRCEGTAGLLVAGANHLPTLVRRLREAEPALQACAQLAEFMDGVYDALAEAEDFLRAASDLGNADARAVLRAVQKVAKAPILEKVAGAASAINPVLDALEAADRDTPR